MIKSRPKGSASRTVGAGKRFTRRYPTTEETKGFHKLGATKLILRTALRTQNRIVSSTVFDKRVAMAAPLEPYMGIIK